MQSKSYAMAIDEARRLARVARQLAALNEVHEAAYYHRKAITMARYAARHRRELRRLSGIDAQTPSAGPFLCCCANVQAEANGTVLLENRGPLRAQHLTPAQAREIAAALIECADHVDRAAMTPEDVARETLLRR